MFKKIIVDKAINQVSVRYNIKVNRVQKGKSPDRAATLSGQIMKALGTLFYQGE